MGLDIYASKIKPSKGVDINSVEELEKDEEKQFKKSFSKVFNKFAKRIKQAITDENAEERAAAINELREYIKSLMPDYKWYWDKLVPETANNEILDKLKYLKKYMYKRSDVYFRKVNFVYRFFQDDLEEECAIIGRDEVQDLVDRCKQVIAAAKKDEVIDDTEKIDDKWFCCKGYYDLSKEEQEKEMARIEELRRAMPTNWTEVAEDLLPTTSGFFFGSTDYDIYYLFDVIDCKNQFQNMLDTWKDDEVAWVIMSW